MSQLNASGETDSTVFPYIARHNCMATADRAIVVFVQKSQWVQRTQPILTSLIQHLPKIIF